MSQVVVVGAGAAGMMAAIAAAQAGHQVLLLEKNEKTGKKIYITGKGRCNATNACSREAFFQNVVSNPKFLYSSLYQFDAQAMMDFLREYGCEVKVERGERVFPVSDHASDVIAALQRALRENYVTIRLHTTVRELLLQKDGAGKKITGVLTTKGEKIPADAVILACGGLSYPATGSDGDGYRLAQQAGHSLQTLHPSLVPFETQEAWNRELQGLSLKNVQIRLCRFHAQHEADLEHPVYEGFGEMLFTHFGLSGPLILTASCFYQKECPDEKAALFLDLKPALDFETLDRRLVREFEENSHKAFKNALDQLFPHKLIPVMIHLSGIDPDRKVYDITRQERRDFTALIKQLPITVTGTRGYAEAIITQGGVEVSEVNPSSMESRLCSGLYLTGELLDLDAVTGGFNLQIAWSTGHLAGASIPWV